MHYAHPMNHLSLSTTPGIEREVEGQPHPSTRDPMDILIELEEELGCSIVQAVKRYRDQVRRERTFDAH